MMIRNRILFSLVINEIETFSRFHFSLVLTFAQQFASIFVHCDKSIDVIRVFIFLWKNISIKSFNWSFSATSSACAWKSIYGIYRHGIMNKSRRIKNSHIHIDKWWTCEHARASTFTQIQWNDIISSVLIINL